MKLGSSEPTPAPAQEPIGAAPVEAPVDPTAAPEMGADTEPSNDVPFEKEPFDAGVDADEASDPKKFIEQLTGKLGQSLRSYTQKQGAPDFELEKFAINSLLSATHTAEMDPDDQVDIIKKVEEAGYDGDTSPSEPDDNAEGGEADDPDNIFSTGEDEPAKDDAMNEMALTDHNTQKLIKLYTNGDDKVRAILNSLVSLNANVSKEEFFKDLQTDIDYDEMKYILGELPKHGIELPEDEEIMQEGLFLDNPPKNNMFQDGSNDKLNETNPCWDGYEQRGMKTKDGKEVPNCVKISEGLEKSKENGIFVDKSLIKAKLVESFNQDDMNEPTTKPEVKPMTKPDVKPDVKPSRKNKPFLPHVEPGTKTAPKAVDEAAHDYPVYHKSFSSAVQAAKDYIEARGFQISDDEIWNKISVGPAKPQDGKYNRYSLEISKNGKEQKKAFHIQVYNTGHNYELNCYVL